MKPAALSRVHQLSAFPGTAIISPTPNISTHASSVSAGSGDDDATVSWAAALAFESVYDGADSSWLRKSTATFAAAGARRAAAAAAAVAVTKHLLTPTACLSTPYWKVWV